MPFNPPPKQVLVPASHPQAAAGCSPAGNRSPCSWCHPHSQLLAVREVWLQELQEQLAQTSPGRSPLIAVIRKVLPGKSQRKAESWGRTGVGVRAPRTCLCWVTAAFACSAGGKNCHTPESHGAEGGSHHQHVSIGCWGSQEHPGLACGTRMECNGLWDLFSGLCPPQEATKPFRERYQHGKS